MEINGLTAVAVGRREARQALCGWTAMLHEFEDQVAVFFEFDVTIGACVADALCAAGRILGDEAALASPHSRILLPVGCEVGRDHWSPVQLQL